MTYATTQPRESKIIFTVTVPFEECEKNIQKALNRIGAKLSVPGFRRGKAPYEIIKQRIGEEEILTEAFPSIVHDSYLKILQERDLHPALPPKITPIQLKMGKSVEYSAESVFAPTVTLPLLSEIRVEKKLKIHISENIRLEEEERANARQSAEMFEKIVKASKFSDIAEELLENPGESKESAMRRVQLDAIIHNVAEQEKIEVTEEEIKDEADLFLRQFRSVKDAENRINPRALIDNVHEMLVRRKVIAFLKEKIGIS